MPSQRIRNASKVGSAPDLRALARMEEFGLTCEVPSRDLPPRFLDQLDACKDDSARRILLGTSSAKAGGKAALRGASNLS